MNRKTGFCAADILLPDFEKVDGTKWAVVACDQYTSEPEYWENAAEIVGDAPSTLRLILPEVYLNETEKRTAEINREMARIAETLVNHPNAMICLARTQSDGSVRKGIIGALDLETYDFHKGAAALTRATEGTVLERIPPRVAIRRDAPMELPHVMLLIDDPKKTVIEPTLDNCASKTPVYDFDLMLGGGHVCAYLLDASEQNTVTEALANLITPDAMAERYGDGTLAPFLFAAGDGNHSLATAKTIYEELKTTLGEEAARRHPARYALVEVVNLHDDALQFEPIYRVVFDCNPDELLAELQAEIDAQKGSAPTQTIRYFTADKAGVLIALICVLVPTNARQHVKLLCSLCVVCLVCSPVIELIGTLASGDWEIPDSWIGQEEQEEQDREQMAQALLSGQLQLALEQQFALTADQCQIFAEWGEDGSLLHITLILSGKAIWKDPDPIKAYVEELLGCRCTVVLD